MRAVLEGDVTRTVERYLQVDARGKQRPGQRERSWDFCFNYFQAQLRPTVALEISCLQLGYYLASWGMLRGRSYLSRTNASHYGAALEVIEQRNEALIGMDLHLYDDPQTRTVLLETYKELTIALLPQGGDAHTLVTKVMLGVWGVIPAFDTYWVGWFRYLSQDNKKERRAFSRPSETSLVLVQSFYADHADEIDKLADRFTTIDFSTGRPTGRSITRAKVLDIYGFQSGIDRATVISL